MAGLQIVSTGLLFGTGLRTTTGLTSGGGLQVSAALSGAAQLLANETQGLAIDFTDLSMVIKDTGSPANAFSGDPNSKLTYASPSTKWILGADGLYSSGTTLRTSYSASGTALGVLIEAARTNLLLQSQTFTNASWSKINATITAGAAVSPDGTSNASKLVESAITNVHNTQQAITKAASAIQYTFSGFIKAGERTWCKLFVFDGAADGQRQYVDLTTGAAGTASAQGAGFTGVTFTSALRPDGWVYFTWLFTTNTATAVQCRVYTASANGTDSYAGDGVSGIYLWNMQLETGGFATSPVVTAGAPVTRAADSISITSSLFPVAGSQTWLAQTRGLNTSIVGSPRILGANSSPDSPLYNAGASVGLFFSPTLYQKALIGTFATTQKLASAADGTSSSLTTGGQIVATGGAGPAAGITALHIGSNSGAADFVNGYIAQVMYLPRRMSNAELQAVTT